MKTAAILMLGALLASSAWARVGETAEQAAERYGPARDTHAGIYSNTIVREYRMAGIRVEATFFTVAPAVFMIAQGKSIIGQIKYSLPYQMAQSNEVAKATLLQLLEANADGQHWEMVANRPATQDYTRPGATATVEQTQLTVTLTGYAAFAESEKARLVTEQGTRIENRMKDF